MSERMITIEAVSLDEAKAKLYREEWVVLRETVLCPGDAGIVSEIAETVKDAIAKAKSKIPPEAEIEKPEIKTHPKRFKIRVKGDSEKIVREKIGADKVKIIESIILHKKARKGFLGFFKRPNIYKVTIFQHALVEIKFREKAKIEAKVCDYLAADLLQNIQNLRLENVQWTEIPRFLNPKNNSKIQQFLEELQTSYFSDLSSALYFIEVECRKHPEDDWQRAIKEAHWRALIARVKNKTKLRQLDVDIAENFMLYTSIHWSVRDYERMLIEPTGLPKEGFDDHHVPSPTLRERIPHYSTNEKVFSKLEERIKGFDLYELYLQFLAKEGEDGAIATLEQKCNAALKARKAKQIQK